MGDDLEEVEARVTRERLLKTLKKEVKQIMEEAVTRKFIHQESSSITTLCSAVDSAFQHGLRKRSLGLFKQSSSSSLLQKISKNCPEANQVVKIVEEVESEFDFTKDIARKILDNKPVRNSKSTTPSYHKMYYWIRVALFEKVLTKIVDYLVSNSKQFYCKGSLLIDPVDGPIFASLLVGPCSLDFTKMKTPDHLWTDPPADELVQRHRIHSGNANYFNKPESPKRPGLQVQRNTSSSSDDSLRGMPVSAKEYVESLHQNTKTVLLYGKNNVLVQPREDLSPMAGYLSLHQSEEGLSIKWTPNQLMNGCCHENRQEDTDRSLYWEYAMTVALGDIVYIHCHQQPNSGGTIVLVGQDGVQQPPIHFPKGGHLLTFLACLENGLLPHGQLDPPLWSQRGKGKVFPKLRRKGSRLKIQQTNGDPAEEGDEPTDYVFRVVNVFKPPCLPEELMDPKKVHSNGFNGFHGFNGFNGFTFPWSRSKSPETEQKENGLNTVHTYAKSQHRINNMCLSKSVMSIKHLCDTMKTQIISRAFYGWMAHCRHLKTVRTHLSGLVLHNALEPTPEPCPGLTEELWKELTKTGAVQENVELFKLVYSGGIEHNIRKEVWPYMLGHYKFGWTPEERASHDSSLKTSYEKTMSEWLAVEAIVKQREKETVSANMARLSRESGTDGVSEMSSILLERQGSSISNEVFIEAPEWSASHYHPEPLMEEDASSETDAPSGATNSDGIVRQRPVLKREQEQEESSIDEGLGDSMVTQRGSHSTSSKLTSCGYDSLDDDRLTVTQAGGAHNDLKNKQLHSDGVGDKPERADWLSVSEITNNLGHLSASKESLVSGGSPVSHGGVYTTEFLDNVGLNLHRIDKDVHRCDRNYWYFNTANLEKLRNIMCTFVWEHLDIGYIQGMCDLVAPLLVIIDDEAITYSCFCELMKRMISNFPQGGAMDVHFANMRSLIQILDSELFEHMHHHGDFTHFYFCYRWFLLDFKRELVYDDIFSVWETIWAARHISSTHFVLFIALALVEFYRDIILDNKMDFTDIIKFFNEMAERHDAKKVLKIARDLILRLQHLIDNQ